MSPPAEASIELVEGPLYLCLVVTRGVARIHVREQRGRCEIDETRDLSTDEWSRIWRGVGRSMPASKGSSARLDMLVAGKRTRVHYDAGDLVASASLRRAVGLLRRAAGSR
jgi:hypothetical protein